jgi:hypothetical protein
VPIDFRYKLCPNYKAKSAVKPKQPDKARELLDKPESEKVFQNVHVPENYYPAILRLNGVSGLGRVREDGVSTNKDPFNARTKRNCVLINKIQIEISNNLRKKLPVSVSLLIETTLHRQPQSSLSKNP